MIQKRLVTYTECVETGFIAVQNVQSYDNVCSPQQLGPLQWILHVFISRTQTGQIQGLGKWGSEAKLNTAPAFSGLWLKLLGKQQINRVNDRKADTWIMCALWLNVSHELVFAGARQSARSSVKIFVLFKYSSSIPPRHITTCFRAVHCWRCTAPKLSPHSCWRCNGRSTSASADTKAPANSAKGFCSLSVSTRASHFAGSKLKDTAARKSSVSWGWKENLSAGSPWTWKKTFAL